MTTNLVVRQEPLATQCSSSSSDDSDSTSASSPIPQVTVTDKIECLNPLGIRLTTLNFVLALGQVKWRHPSVEGMPILQFVEPLPQVPFPQTIEPANPVAQANDI
ncbi:hypothetical protein LIER_11283 [Lithospermum erythrorhizon]|uniref:Uncharacterized protein n=1 Tax=Lithospermum erythrorhizon TaxID=34254 RepID=A0AAV3PMH9_LITER